MGVGAQPQLVNNGAKLGPVGSPIVAEVFGGLLAADVRSYYPRGWNPDGGVFRAQDLMREAGMLYAKTEEPADPPISRLFLISGVRAMVPDTFILTQCPSGAWLVGREQVTMDLPNAVLAPEHEKLIVPFFDVCTACQNPGTAG